MSNKNIKLLIIDDEEQMRKVLSYIIQNSELMVSDILESSSANEAMNIFKDNKVDIIICDYLLNDIRGIEFFSKISNQYPDVVKILISGNVNYDELREAVKKGEIFKFIAKPFNEDEIISVLKDAIERVKNIRSRQDLMNRLKDF